MYTLEMQKSIEAVEATRQARLNADLKRMTADEKENLLKKFHPDYKEEGFSILKIGANKGDKVPTELADL